MQNKNIGVQCFGVKCPIIREGDDLEEIVLDSIKNTGIELQDNDVIGITESVVARANGNYVTIDDIVQFLKEHDVRKELYLRRPIMSRNRFSMILKAFARYADSICLDYVDCPDVKTDEVGNPVWGVNPFTGVDVMSYYEEICKNENCEFNTPYEDIPYQIIDCRCHPIDSKKLQSSCKTRLLTLADIMNEPVTREDGTTSGYNKEWGLLGSNKANEETLKLFSMRSSAQKLVEQIQHKIECEYTDLLASLFDLTTGSGSRGCPITDLSQGSPLIYWWEDLRFVLLV